MRPTKPVPSLNFNVDVLRHISNSGQNMTWGLGNPSLYHSHRSSGLYISKILQFSLPYNGSEHYGCVVDSPINHRGLSILFTKHPSRPIYMANSLIQGFHWFTDLYSAESEVPFDRNFLKNCTINVKFNGMYEN